MESTMALLESLPPHLRAAVRRAEPLWRYTTLRVGGPADLYLRVTDAEDLAAAAEAAQRSRVSYFLLGGGSNVCISDRGVRGLVIHNDCRRCEIGEITRVDAGYSFMRLFQNAIRAGLSGLEFAVGIPGSVGGAMVSNAGAYRQNICDLVLDVDVVEGGDRKVVGPEWMGFSYRDSRLRRSPSPHGPLSQDRERGGFRGASSATIVAVTMRLEPKPRRDIRARAADNQRQRIYKQPWYPSAGSFFKNVYSRTLADQLPDLPAAMREAGVVPAGYLSSAVGCRGLTVGGAQISRRHGNFVVNRGEATAGDIRALTDIVHSRVREQFGVELETEVLLVGDWGG